MSQSLTVLTPSMASSFSPNKMHLRIAADTWRPWFAIENANGMDLSNAEYSGVLWHVLEHLQQAMNFTYSMVRPPDGKWGSKEANGSWNGMIGMLNRNEVDMAIGPFSVTIFREEACDFSVPLVIDSWSVLMPAPAVTADPAVMIRPFDIWTWIGVVVSLPSILLTFVLMSYVFHGETRFSRLSDFVIRMVVSAQTKWEPDQWTHERVLNFLGSWGFEVLSLSYSGLLVSMFAVPAFVVTINRPIVCSIAVLLNQSEIPWAIEVGSIMENVGRSAPTGSQLNTMYENAIFTGLCAPNKEKIKAGEFAEICLLSDIYAILSADFTETATCNLIYAENTFLPVQISMAVQSQSDLLAPLNKELRSLLENGLISQWLLQAQPNVTNCLTRGAIKEAKIKEQDSPTIELSEVARLFFIGLICLGVSLLVFVLRELPARRKIDRSEEILKSPELTSPYDEDAVRPFQRSAWMEGRYDF